mmetsp:Transcript_20422/g.78501  ORF Transcript_20422/g.78501 Transcript_20422/m.78501 type:complete len:227 (-) Transcript_20422:865-1545(-)
MATTPMGLCGWCGSMARSRGWPLPMCTASRRSSARQWRRQARASAASVQRRTARPVAGASCHRSSCRPSRACRTFWARCTPRTSRVWWPCPSGRSRTGSRSSAGRCASPTATAASLSRWSGAELSSQPRRLAGVSTSGITAKRGEFASRAKKDLMPGDCTASGSSWLRQRYLTPRWACSQPPRQGAPSPSTRRARSRVPTGTWSLCTSQGAWWERRCSPGARSHAA